MRRLSARHAARGLTWNDRDRLEHAAQEHRWDALEPHLRDPRVRRAIAMLRVTHGEDLTGVPDHPDHPPPRLEAWEPRYPVVWRNDQGGSTSSIPERPDVPVAPLPTADALPPDDFAAALLEFPRSWSDRSNGERAAAHVRGSAAAAVAALGYDRAGLLPIAERQALQDLVTACAGGGAYDGGDGIVVARERTWRLRAAIAGRDLRWFAFAPGTDPGEWIWELHLAAEDAAAGEAWALSARDVD